MLFLIWFTAGSLAFPLFQRICNPNFDPLPYSGYRGELIVSSKKVEFHLYMCKENHLLEDTFDSTTLGIPWAKNISSNAATSTSKVVARRRNYSIWDWPIFLPESHIGALYDQELVLPLLAEKSLSNQWVELRNFRLLYHIPIFYTPDWNSKRHPVYSSTNSDSKESWHHYISMTEDYKLLIDKKTINLNLAKKLKNQFKVNIMSIFDLCKLVINPTKNLIPLIEEINSFYTQIFKLI